jgi:hypothetical protein
VDLKISVYAHFFCCTAFEKDDNSTGTIYKFDEKNDERGADIKRGTSRFALHFVTCRFLQDV